MSYLLDTNTCIEYLDRRNLAIRERLAALSATELVLCSIVKAELYYGAYRSTRRAENMALLTRFFAQFTSLPFDDVAAETAGRIRAELAGLGTPIGPNDLLIAAIALANNVTLVTHNTREFSRVLGLRVEDWEGST